MYAYEDVLLDKILQSTRKEIRPKTISRYFVGYAKNSKGYRFYWPSHTTRFVESRNAKFLENDIINGSDLSKNTVLEKDLPKPSTLSDRLVIIHNTPQVQPGVEQLIAEVPLLKMILEIKLLKSYQKLLSNQLNNMLLRRMQLQH